MNKEQPEALPVRLAKRLCDGISTGHDWPNTDDELLRMQSGAELRRLHAENEALRAQIGQGVPDGWQLVPKEPTDAMVRAALHLDLSYMPGHDGPDRAAVYKAMLASAPPAPQKLTTCNCRWDGDTQVQHCTLHQAHIDAIHEWAERVKTAEAELAAQQQKPLTDEQIKDEEWRLSAEREYDKWTGSEYLVVDGAKAFARAIEAAHNIGEKK